MGKASFPTVNPAASLSIQMEVRSVLNLKAPAPMLVIPLPIIAEVKLFSEKAWFPIEVTLSGFITQCFINP